MKISLSQQRDAGWRGRCSVLGLFHLSPRSEKEVPGGLQQSRDE